MSNFDTFTAPEVSMLREAARRFIMDNARGVKGSELVMGELSYLKSAVAKLTKLEAAIATPFYPSDE